MTITTTPITGTILLPNGDVPAGGVVEFVLSNFDTVAGEDTTIVPQDVVADIDGSGDISVSLWANAEGTRLTRYVVTVILSSSRGGVRIKLGEISVPTTGTHDLNDLLAIPLPVADRAVVRPQDFGDIKIDASAAWNAAWHYAGFYGVPGESWGVLPCAGAIRLDGKTSWNFHNTELHWTGTDVTDLTPVLHNPDGTTEAEPSGKYTFVDTKGASGSSWRGALAVVGSFPGNMQMANTLVIPKNGVGMTCSEGFCSRVTFDKIEVRGFGRGLFQGEQRGLGSKVLPYTRWTGNELLVRFCDVGIEDGRGGNGLDEFHVRNVELSRNNTHYIVQTNTILGNLFLKGKRWPQDAEAATATTDGTTDVVLSADVLDGDDNTLIEVGMKIAIEGASWNYEESKAQAHVSRISAWNAATKTLTLETPPPVDVTDAAIIFNPPAGTIERAELILDHLYSEMANDVPALLLQGGRLTCPSMKAGDGTFDSRYGCLVADMGLSETSIRGELHQRSGPGNDNLRCLVGVATRYNGTLGKACNIRLVSKHSMDAFSFPIVAGIQPESDHVSAAASVPGVPGIDQQNIVVEYPEGDQAYRVLTHGPAHPQLLTTGVDIYTLGANLRAAEDMTGITGSGACGAPSGGVVAKTAGNVGTWYQSGVGTLVAGDKYQIEGTVDALSQGGITFQFFRSQGAETPAGTPMLPRGINIRAPGPFKFIIAVPSGLASNRVGFNCEAGAVVTLSRFVVRPVEIL